MMKVFKVIIPCFLVAYVALCLSVYLKPEWFFYAPYDFPGSLSAARREGLKAQEVTYFDYGKQGGKVEGWLYVNDTSLNNHQVILFLHGNSYNLQHYSHKLIAFENAGYSVFIPEYRGFGGQGNKIKQSYLEQDTVNAVKYLNKLGFANENIVVYGMSLGTYMALYGVWHEQHNGNFAALVLEVPFMSLLQTAEDHVTFGGIKLVPLDLLLKDTYNNYQLIDKVKTKVLIMGTYADKVIPPVQALQLYDLAVEPKKLIMYQNAAHDELYDLRNYDDILQWLDNK